MYVERGATLNFLKSHHNGETQPSSAVTVSHDSFILEGNGIGWAIHLHLNLNLLKAFSRDRQGFYLGYSFCKVHHKALTMVTELRF